MKHLNHYYDCQWEPKCNLWTLLLAASFGQFFAHIFSVLITVIVCVSYKFNSCHGRETIWLGYFSLEKPLFDILCLCCAVVHVAYGPLNLLYIMHRSPSIYPRAFCFWLSHFEQKWKLFKWFFSLRCKRITVPNFTFPEIELRSPWFPLKYYLHIYYYKECKVLLENSLKLVMSTTHRSCVFISKVKAQQSDINK